MALHTTMLEMREGVRERVAEHRKWNKQANRWNASKARDRWLEVKDQKNAERRERERMRRLLDPEGMRAKERAKWEKRKAKFQRPRTVSSAVTAPASLQTA